MKSRQEDDYATTQYYNNNDCWYYYYYYSYYYHGGRLKAIIRATITSQPDSGILLETPAADALFKRNHSPLRTTATCSADVRSFLQDLKASHSLQQASHQTQFSNL